MFPQRVQHIDISRSIWILLPLIELRPRQHVVIAPPVPSRFRLGQLVAVRLKLRDDLVSERPDAAAHLIERRRGDLGWTRRCGFDPAANHLRRGPDRRSFVVPPIELRPGDATQIRRKLQLVISARHQEHPAASKPADEQTSLEQNVVPRDLTRVTTLGQEIIRAGHEHSEVDFTRVPLQSFQAAVAESKDALVPDRCVNIVLQFRL